jgi:hypothetical protein
VIKSVHIKECWPFEYKVEETRAHKKKKDKKYPPLPMYTKKGEQTQAQKAYCSNLVKAREAIARKKALALLSEKEDKRFLDLKVYDMGEDICQSLNAKRLNNAIR